MQYDLVVIGAGWAGFNAALRAKELGFKAALVEKEKLGGVCLNRGCIPTKALLQSAKSYTAIKKSASLGIEGGCATFNLSAIQERKERVISQLQSGIDFSLKGLDVFHGQAKVISPNIVEVEGEKLHTDFILIACGSKPFVPQSLKSSITNIITSDELLEIREVPESLLIIGGGVIGCEFATLFNSFGTQVSIVELMPQLLPGVDRDISRKLENIFKKKGIHVQVNTDAKNALHTDYEKVLCCVGRAPDTAGFGLEEAGIKLEKGRIITDENLKTSVPNIYAAGDCTSKLMLAHAASYQGITAVTNIFAKGAPKKADSLIPSAIFTDPEIGCVGLTEEGAASAGKELKVQKFDLLGSGVCRILDETEGFIKVITDKNTDELLGASIIGARATELIATLTVAMQNKIKAAQLKETVFAHPTLSEIIEEVLKK